MASRIVRGVLLVSTLALLPGCRDPSDPGDEALQPNPPEDDGEDEGDTDAPTGRLGDRCEDAVPISPGTVQGTLRSLSSTEGGACGLGGPEAFYRIDVPRRADLGLRAVGRGFEPVIGVAPADCVLDWDTRALGCVRGVPGWITDLAAGTKLVVAVGIEPDDPALSSFAMDAIDPLDFELAVQLRDILGEGELCRPPGNFRCEGGTACLPETTDAPDSGEEPDEHDATFRCRRLQADTCAAAESLQLELGTGDAGEIVIEPDAIHTDAHAHACTGARAPERVYLLSVSRDAMNLEPGTMLSLQAFGATGLAIRGADCDPASELACDAVSEDSDSILSASVPVDEQTELFVFVELPLRFAAGHRADDAMPGEEAPITLRWELVDPS